MNCDRLRYSVPVINLRNKIINIVNYFLLRILAEM